MSLCGVDAVWCHSAETDSVLHYTECQDLSLDMTTGVLAQCDMNNCRETMEGPSSSKLRHLLTHF